MKTIVTVIVHDRTDNIKEWIHCWNQCDQKGAQLVIIQNDCGNEDVKKLCEQYQVKYLLRENKGYDIGAFQDVCRERLKGFDNDWDVMLWCTDDTFPMRKDFLSPFLNKIYSSPLPFDKLRVTGEAGGVACAYVSPFVKKHIRTTGFAITKAVANKLEFDKDPVMTKADCYQFEHQSKNAFYEQVLKMRLPVTQVDNWAKGPLWDSGYGRGKNRMKEHQDVFPREEKAPVEKAAITPAPVAKTKKVAFICPAYNSYPQIISSLICQTYTNWELFLLHDGPNETGIKDLITDPRIKYQETKERAGKWGHSLRQWALANMDTLCPDADYIVITNADNYHVPVYTEYLLKAFENNPNLVAAYCSDMGHSYVAWKTIACRLQLGYIDCACVMIKKEAACEVGWRDTESHSSDWTYFSDVIQKYGANKWAKVPGCLLIHN